MRLWIDDIRPAPSEFELVAKNAHEAIRHLESGLVSEVSLDHDLGGQGVDATGYFVAKWIEEAAHNGKLPRLQWAIHSANPVGRQYMEMALQNADRYWAKRENKS